MEIGIIREGKVPPDKRVPFTPSQCAHILELHPEISITVQPSAIRSFTDGEYAAAGIRMDEDLSHCDVLFGVKEVPVDMLLPGKTYFFFSHTYKEQPYNRALLKAILDRQIRLVDYELLKDSDGQRIIGFGRYAGIVGAYSGMKGWGMLTGAYNIKSAHECEDMEEMLDEMDQIRLPSGFKLVLTGKGRVGRGAEEIIQRMAIRELDPETFLAYAGEEPVFTILGTEDYNRHKDGRRWDKALFYSHPEEYESDFMRFAKEADMYIPCHYWDSAAPQILTAEDLRHPELRLKMISDVSMDIKEPIASTIRPSVIGDAYYAYDPFTASEVPFGTEGSIGVQAVDNLPCELPKDASKDFGQVLMDKVLPALLGHDPEQIIHRASQTTPEGSLNEGFEYLEGYLAGQ